MKEIIVYLIIALMVLITYNILYEGKDSKELSILTLAMALGLSDNPIEWIIAISGIVTMLLSTGDEETSTLFLLAIMGMLVIVNTNLLILIYLGLELIALTLYVLAARERKSVKSTEAGIKYLILGALSTGILLLGMSLAYATTGTTSLESVSGTAATLIKIGLLFKIGATPFHMWVPDVYEGAPIIVTTFIAVVPKIAYASVLINLVTGLDLILITSGILSIIIGSIGALNQTKFKRMLGYSAIGHMGFVLLGIGTGTWSGFLAAILYLVIYIIITFNNFTVVMETGLNKIVEVRGLSRKNGVLAITMGTSLMAIAGIPPLVGFMNKFLVIKSVVESQLIGIAIIAVILSVVSAFYYVRIIRWMYFEDQVDVTQTITRVSAWGSIILGITTWAIISLFIYPTSLYTVFSSILPYTTTLLLV